MLEIKALSEGTAEVFVYGKIGWDVDASQFVRELAGMEVEQVTVRVNSPGGDVYSGLAIMNALRSHPATVTAVVEGLAASAASFIAVGGADRVVMRKGSELMIHDAMSFVGGNAEEMQRAIEDLDRVSDNLAAIYADRAGGDATDWRELMRAETWYTADEAVAAGLADSVEDGRPAKEVAPQMAGVMNSFKYSSRRTAPPPPTVNAHEGRQPERETMTAIADLAQILGTDEDSVLNALSKIVNADEAPVEAESVEEAVVDEPVEEPEAEAVEEAPEAVEEAAEEAPAQPDTITLDRDTYEDLKMAAKLGWEAKNKADAAERAAEVDAWISEGRVNVARREKVLAHMEQDADGARALYGNIPKNTIPRAEAGYGREEADKGKAAKDALNQKAAGFLSAPDLY